MDDTERRATERKLERDLEPLQGTENPLECAPAFAEFARALFRADAGKLLKNAATWERFDTDMEALLARTIEEIMPDASLDISRAPGAGATPPNIVRDNVTGTLWEVGADGVLRLATDPTYAAHGDWERLAPPGVRFFVRRSLYPVTNAAIRDALECALRAEKTYWMGRYILTRSTPLDLLDHIHRQLSSWEEAARRISVASGIKVSRSALFAWRRAQMGKDPGKPVKAATAQKIADGIRRVAVEPKILPS